MLPKVHFFVNDEATAVIRAKCATHDYQETDDLEKGYMYFYVTHDFVTHCEMKVLKDTKHFICVFIYGFYIDYKDTLALEEFFTAFTSGREFYFSRGYGLLRYFVEKDLRSDYQKPSDR